jgi:hypothetical protein
MDRQWVFADGKRRIIADKDAAPAFGRGRHRV